MLCSTQVSSLAPNVNLRPCSKFWEIATHQALTTQTSENLNLWHFWVIPERICSNISTVYFTQVLCALLSPGGFSHFLQHGAREERKAQSAVDSRRLYSPPAYSPHTLRPSSKPRRSATLPVHQTARAQRIHSERRAQSLRRKRPCRRLRSQSPRFVCRTTRWRESGECGVRRFCACAPAAQALEAREAD